MKANQGLQANILDFARPSKAFFSRTPVEYSSLEPHSQSRLFHEDEARDGEWQTDGHTRNASGEGEGLSSVTVPHTGCGPSSYPATAWHEIGFTCKDPLSHVPYLARALVRRSRVPQSDIDIYHARLSNIKLGFRTPCLAFEQPWGRRPMSFGTFAVAYLYDYNILKLCLLQRRTRTQNKRRESKDRGSVLCR